MPVEKAILVDGSRLMRDIVRHVIKKITNIVVVKECENLEDLLANLNEFEPEWLFLVMSADYLVSDALLTEILLHHPQLRIVSFWADGSHVKTEWLGRQEHDITGFTLDQLTDLLQNELRMGTFSWNGNGSSEK